MIGKSLISSRLVSLAEVYDILKKRKDEGELSYEQKLTHQYAGKFKKITPKKTLELYSKLIEIDGVSELFAVKLVDLMPTDLDELKLVVPRGEEVKEETLNKVFELVKKYEK
ncbi:MAG: RNA polymerase Rpb4 family protein [archaeon]